MGLDPGVASAVEKAVWGYVEYAHHDGVVGAEQVGHGTTVPVVNGPYVHVNRTGRAPLIT